MTFILDFLLENIRSVDSRRHIFWLDGKLKNSRWMHWRTAVICFTDAIITIFIRRVHFGSDSNAHMPQNTNGERRRKCVFGQNQNSNEYSNSGSDSSCYTNNFAFIEFIQEHLHGIMAYIRTSALRCGWLLPLYLYLYCALILLLVFTRNKWDFSRLKRRVLA